MSRLDIPCDRCPVVPMCLHKNGLDLIMDCPHLNLHLTTEGRKTEMGQHTIVGVESLRMRFIVTKNSVGTIHIGHLETPEAVDADAWYVNYGGSKCLIF